MPDRPPWALSIACARAEKLPESPGPAVSAYTLHSTCVPGGSCVLWLGGGEAKLLPCNAIHRHPPAPTPLPHTSQERGSQASARSCSRSQHPGPGPPPPQLPVEAHTRPPGLRGMGHPLPRPLSPPHPIQTTPCVPGVRLGGPTRRPRLHHRHPPAGAPGRGAGQPRAGWVRSCLRGSAGTSALCTLQGAAQGQGHPDLVQGRQGRIPRLMWR